MRMRLALVALSTIAAAAAAPTLASPSHPADVNPNTRCNDGTVTWTPTTVWPPNHKMQTITISYADSDNDGDSISITVGAITDNQAASDGTGELPGSGQPTQQQGLDWAGTGNTGSATDPGTATTTAQVRAERSGTDPSGRTYTIMVTCSDMGGSNNEMETQTVPLTVTVPHDQGRN